MTKSSGFKMKGSPMQRNFGISPMKDRETVEQYASGEKEVTVSGDARSSAELLALADKAEKDGNMSAANKMRNKASKKVDESKSAQNYLDQTA